MYCNSCEEGKEGSYFNTMKGEDYSGFEDHDRGRYCEKTVINVKPKFLANDKYKQTINGQL